ncbi:ABC1 family-domain-containing protein [Cantharellus anzutake]|uniref:ABC1 family-domain-containing protein n=1 Tax=Cantharellus anzutake TaxID=1750568 RepID=UPI00190759F5|nr:ABC1 family-domain-containing protein [Cantharellus anzutake]KAF8319580.1 ABC1 family-domain-containing protein [Cantharellus anzutake]
MLLLRGRSFRSQSPIQRPLTQRTIARLHRGLTRTSVTLAFLGLGGWTAFETSDSFQHFVHAVRRCSIIGEAVICDVIDYKHTLQADFATEEEKLNAQSRCHKRSAERILEALKINGGHGIVQGQHISSVNLLPIEWTSTMKPLQDQCFPTPYEDVAALFKEETGQELEEVFSWFSREPIGVASLAQVHTAIDRNTGRKVAVKIQHPRLEEWAHIDMAATTVALAWVKRVFPEFEFSWLGEEVRTNLPLELNFLQEADNTSRVKANFADVKHTSLYIPEVLSATKRTLVMEFISGARVDDLDYLARHKIDRNQVSQELSRIFSTMVYLHGFFHADPHAGNLLIRPKPVRSRSPYNFEIALLDHGLYFDVDDELRINYAKLWLSLITPGGKEDRRKYAQLVANIGPDLYPIFESSITGRPGLEGTWEDAPEGVSARPRSMLELSTQSEEELERMRGAVLEREGLLVSVFSMLRVVPRAVLMLFKMNDLLRNLDAELKTTHDSTRVFLIVARYCSSAVWRDDCRGFFTRWRDLGASISLFTGLVRRWFAYHLIYDGLRIIEWEMDFVARYSVFMLARYLYSSV